MLLVPLRIQHLKNKVQAFVSVLCCFRL